MNPAHPVGSGFHIHPWRRTRDLTKWLLALKNPEAQVLADNILYDGHGYKLKARKAASDYPGHAAAIKRLTHVITQSASLRPPGPLMNGLLKFIRDLPFTDAVGVEIGSYIGESSVAFGNSGKFKLLTCVDIWISWAGPGEAVFDERTRDIPCIQKLKVPSVEAATMFADASLDFVYIDAGHDYDDVKADILAWQHKVKPGGILSGHDFDRNHGPLRRAVKELLGTPDRVYADSTWVKRR